MGDGYMGHHIKIMKVALAIAILRQKPETVSAVDFTHDLALRLQGSEVRWRGRAHELERELLRTRQELVTCQLQAAHLTSQAGAEGWSQCSHGGEEEKECQSEGYFSARPPGSGGAPGGMAPAAPGGLSVSTPREKVEEGDEGFDAHVKFCHSLSRIERLHRKLPPAVACVIQDTFKDTMLDAIRGLKESLSGANRLSCPQKILSVIPCITDFLCSSLLAPAKLELTDAVISLADVLLISEEGSELASEQWLQSALVGLCGVQAVLVHVTQTLTGHLCTSATLFLKTLGNDGEGMTMGLEVGGEVGAARRQMVGLEAGLVDAARRQTATLEAILTRYDASKNIAGNCEISEGRNGRAA